MSIAAAAMILVSCSSSTTPTELVVNCGMFPTLAPGDRVEVGPPGRLQRGDIVFYVTPDGAATSPRPGRVVGLPGEQLRTAGGSVFIDGSVINESYLPPPGGATPASDVPATIVPDGDVFIFGDNRAASVDSRFFGPVSQMSIRSRLLRVPDHQNEPATCTNG